MALRLILKFKKVLSRILIAFIFFLATTSVQNKSRVFMTRSMSDQDYKFDFIGLDEQKGFVTVYVRIEGLNDSSISILEDNKRNLMFDTKSLLISTEINQEFGAKDVIYENNINSVKLQFKFEGIERSKIKKLIYKDNYFTHKNQIYSL